MKGSVRKGPDEIFQLRISTLTLAVSAFGAPGASRHASRMWERVATRYVLPGEGLA